MVSNASFHGAILRDVLPDLAQAPATVGTGIDARRQLHLHPGDVVARYCAAAILDGQQQMVRSGALAGRDEPEFRQVPSQGIDCAGASPDEVVAHPVQHECRLLCFALHGDKAHAGALHRFAAGFGTGITCHAPDQPRQRLGIIASADPHPVTACQFDLDTVVAIGMVIGDVASPMISTGRKCASSAGGGSDPGAGA